MADVYKIAVEIALAGTIIQGLESISSHLFGINKSVGQVGGNFQRWAIGVGGVASIMASGVIVKGLEKAVEAGGELVKQQTLLRNMGVTQADVTATTYQAQLATQQVIGTTIAENIKGMRELMGVMPSLDAAQSHYVPIMQGAKVLESLTGASATETLQTLAKAVELRGGGVDPKTHELDPARLEREVQAAVKAIVASGGMVNQQKLFQLMQQAGPMARMIDNPDTFYKGILTAVMDMGGFRAGTALTAVGRQLLGGKMTKPTAEEMQRLGLLKEGQWHKSGTGVYVDPGGLTGENILKDGEQGVAKWFNDVFIPALRKHGIESNADVQQELYRVFGTETARRLAGLYTQNQGQIIRDAQLYDNALPDSYQNLAKGDLQGNLTNLTDSVTNFLQSFGSPLVRPAIDGLQSVSSVFNSMAGWATAHPETAKLIGKALIGLAAGLAVFGGVAVIAAAAALVPGGIIAGAILGIGAAITVLAAMNWNAVKSGFDTIKTAISGFIDWLSGIAGQVTGWMKNLFTAPMPGVTDPKSQPTYDPTTGVFAPAMTPEQIGAGVQHNTAIVPPTSVPQIGAGVQNNATIIPPTSVPQIGAGVQNNTMVIPPTSVPQVGRALQNNQVAPPSDQFNPALGGININGAAPPAPLPADPSAIVTPQKQSFLVPAKQQKPTVLKSALNLDGRQLAEAISYAMADLFENSPNAPTGNGSALAALNGWNPVV